ncbi:hypothetical protein PR202_ga12225 [Eleusine coracana subsp. coracana]|uniref:Auxilin-related protein 2 n=1 Tax=Eleusine coracana subsp. coracana TaxID=191504 RepID=A0AAV5CBI6_ELECO|nr:hypothetical protein PR202_ga12225 [Eleusine coracana subsp. coracana]
MDDFQGLLARDFGLRPQGKAAPMAAARSSASSGSARPNPRSTPAPAAAPSAPSYDDLFGSAAASAPPKSGPSPSASLDSIFDSFKEPSAAGPPPKPKHSSMPVYDKPVYDDDIFDGVPGVKSSSARYDDVFAGSSAAPPVYDDLLAGLGKKSEAREGSAVEEKRRREPASASTGFDDLIPGFGGSSRQRDAIGAKEKKVSMSSKPTASMSGDPFVVLEATSSSAGPFTDPLDEFGKAAKYQGKSHEDSGVDSSLFEDSSTFNRAPKSEPLFTSEVNNRPKDRNNSSKARDSSPVQSIPKRNSAQHPSVENYENIFPKSQSARYSDVHVDIASEKYSGNGVNDQSPRSDESEDEIWLTVSEIPLFTQPTSAPPPSRPPPSLAAKKKLHGSKAKRKDDAYQRHSSQNYSHHRSTSNQAGVSSIDKLEDFATGKSQNADAFNEEEFERSAAAAASAAAMKEAMDKAEAKFKHAKEVRERERDAKLRNREQQQQADEARLSAQDREAKERKEKLEQEREQRRLEEERELERQKEREKARQAVERATKEARERAAAEARAKAEREARQRAERAAVQRAQQEARERAAVGAKERAERAAAEAKERAAAEAKEKAANQARDRAAAERAAVDRAQQEARRRAERAAVEKAAAEARERQAAAAAAAAREKQNQPDDLESFFGMGARANSAPKQRAPTVAKALAEKNERDMQIQREQAERDRIGETLDFEIKRWAAGKEGNLRALLSTLQYVLWPECGWQPVSLTDLITAAAVKKVYRKATLCIHPDKVQQKGANLQQKYIAEKVFDLLKSALIVVAVKEGVGVGVDIGVLGGGMSGLEDVAALGLDDVASLGLGSATTSWEGVPDVGVAADASPCDDPKRRKFTLCNAPWLGFRPVIEPTSRHDPCDRDTDYRRIPQRMMR